MSEVPFSAFGPTRGLTADLLRPRTGRGTQRLGEKPAQPYRLEFTGGR